MSSMLLTFAGQAAPSNVVVDLNPFPVTGTDGSYIIAA